MEGIFHPSPPIVDVSDGPWSGAYILHILVTERDTVTFGRFDDGVPVVVEPGNYLYIGSARSRRSGYALAHRVLRHLTRTGDRPPQTLRQSMLAHLHTHGWPAAKAPARKMLRWHVDYLLDRLTATVVQVLVFRGDGVDEHQLVARLTATGATAPLRPGLGAGDHPHHTHLLRWTASNSQWYRFVEDLTRQLPAA